MKSYRPITTSSVLVKVLEILMRKRMMKFINNFNSSNSNQFRFIPDYKTSESILMFLDKAKIIMKKKCT